MPVWGGESIDYLVEKEAVNGYGDGTFRPNAKLTRAHAAKILAVSLNLPIQEEAKSTFPDTRNHWADPYVAAIQKELQGVIKGYPDGHFKPNRPITRAQLTKMVVEAYNLKRDSTTHIYFSDMPDAYANYIQTLGSLGIVQGPVKGEFRPYENVTRLQMAAIIHRTEVRSVRLFVPKKEAIPKIEEITVFNETKFDVRFTEALRPEIAQEIEDSGRRFVVYVEGQTLHDKSAIQSQTIRFNKTYTKATVILAENKVRSDTKYTVALLDADNRRVADVLEQFTPLVLKEGTAQPTVIIDEKQGKVIVRFHENMADTALDANNFHIYESGKLRGSLADYSRLADDEKGVWSDATEKTTVEFTLSDEADKNHFSIGRMYKMVIANKVETVKGMTLSEREGTVHIQTPMHAEVEPKAKFARIVGDAFVITFDQQLTEGAFNPQLITIQKANGHEIPAAKINLASSNNALDDQEMEVTVAEGYTLDPSLTYTVKLPENTVANAIFPNVMNKRLTGLMAEAQKDIEVRKVTAQLQRQANDKSKANLHLTFDQRIDLRYLKMNYKEAIRIQSGQEVYQLINPTSITLDAEDTRGRTIVIQDVEKAFTLNGDVSKQNFQLQSGQGYEVKIARSMVKTENGLKVNQETLTSHFTGVGVSAPKFDQIVLASAEEIILYFKEEIDGAKLQPHHVKVKGFEQYQNGNFTKEPIVLTGKSQLKTHIEGRKLTITPANSEVKFVTSEQADLIEIQGDVLKGRESGIANTKLSTEDLVNTLVVVDRALPVMIGAQKEDDRTLLVTYSEPVAFTGKDIHAQAAQFTVENATKNAYGEQVVLQSPNDKGYTENLQITFNKKGTFLPDLDLEEVKVVYKQHPAHFVKDPQGNSQKEGRTGVTQSPR